MGKIRIKIKYLADVASLFKQLQIAKCSPVLIDKCSTVTQFLTDLLPHLQHHAVMVPSLAVIFFSVGVDVFPKDLLKN